jgi:hypothetical protein
LGIKALSRRSGKGSQNSNFRAMLFLRTFGWNDAMKFAVFAALLASTALAGCMGPEGNPDGMAYADEPGGALAVKPLTVGTVSYDPYATPAPFADMQMGQPAFSPQPMPLPAQPAPPPRSR